MSFKTVRHFVCYNVKDCGYYEKSSRWPSAYATKKQLLVMLVTDLISEKNFQPQEHSLIRRC